MIQLSDVLSLEKGLSDKQVLSVYVNSSLSDPAERRVWRTVLDQNLASIRSSLADESHAEREAFESAVALLMESLPDNGDIHGSKGWAGFFTSDGSSHVFRLPTSVPNVAGWDAGIRVSPIIRAMKQLTPLTVVIVNGSSARVLRYIEGELCELEPLEVEPVIGPVYHMGDSPRGGFHVGVRGSTGTEEAERVSRAAAARLHKEILERLAKVAADDGWLLIGGNAEACAEIERAMPSRMRDRTMSNTALGMKSRIAEIRDAARVGASGLRSRRDGELVAVIAELAAAGGRGAVGARATRAALRDRSVHTLLFTSRFMELQGDAAEELVRLALRQGSEIEHVTGEAAARLDEEFEGVAARLRFVRENVKAV